jgi:class 3 adenylate cyclase
MNRFKFNLRFALSTSTIFILGLVSVVYFFLLIFAIEDIAKNSLKRSLTTSVNICSSILDPNEIDSFTKYEQEQSEVFINYRKQIVDIKQQIENIKFIYIVRQTDTNITYIIDCGDDVSEQAKLGEVYDDAGDGLKELFKNAKEKIHFENDYYTDKWGTFLSAYKPVFKNGKLIYVVCSDIKSVDADKYIIDYKKKFTCVFFTLLILICPIIIWMTNAIRKPLYRVRDEILKLRDLNLDGHIDFNSNISEVNDMIDATDKVKTGLRSFAKYVPDKVVKQLITQGKDAKIGGEKTYVTVLFSDIEGFTTISENNDVDEVVTSLNEYFDVYVHCLEESGATVDKFIGDAVMAFWNAPNKIENHESVAVATALKISDEIDKLNKRWEFQGKKFIFKTRIGINCGEVIVGNIGSSNRMNYTVTGDTVNLASRLEAANKTYKTKILVSESVYEKSKDDIAYHYVVEVKVKGKDIPVKVYEPLNLKSKS